MIYKIFYTFLVFILLGLSLNYGYNKIIPDEETKSLNEIKNNFNGEIDYLFIGDSHPKFSINPKYFENVKVYNFSFSTINYISIYHNLEILLNKENIKINNIFLELDPQNFSEKRYINNGLKNYKFYSNYYRTDYISDINNESKTLIRKKIIKEKFFSYMGNFYNLLTNFKRIILNQKNNEYYGWKAGLSRLNDLTSVKVRINNTYDKNYAFSNKGYYYFEKTIKLAKENNIKINFIKYPLSQEYLNIINDNYYNDYQKNALEIINKNLNNDYNIYDYSNFNNKNYELFNDPDHLNIKGSEIFSKELYNKIILGK